LTFLELLELYFSLTGSGASFLAQTFDKFLANFEPELGNHLTEKSGHTGVDVMNVLLGRVCYRFNPLPQNDVIDMH